MFIFRVSKRRKRLSRGKNFVWPLSWQRHDNRSFPFSVGTHAQGGREGRGGEMTDHASSFTVHDSLFTVHDSQFTIHG